MFIKKILATYRNWLIHLVQFLIPIIFLSLAFFVVRHIRVLEALPPRKITLADYSEPITLIDERKDIGLNTEFKNFLKKDNYEVTNVNNIDETFIEKTRSTPIAVRRHYIIACSFDLEKIQHLVRQPPSALPIVTGYFNNAPYHSAPLIYSVILNVALRAHFGEKYELIYVNYPLRFSPNAELAKVKRGSSMGFVIGFNQCFAMCFSISIFIIFCIKERICKSKHLQFLSGIQAIVFWAVAFIWDFLVYAVMTAMILLVLCAFQEDGFKTIAELNRTAAVYLVFGFSCLPMIYLLSLVFDDPATGYTKAVLILIFLGPTPYAVIQFMQLPQFDLRNIADPIDSVFLYVPIYSFSKSVRMIYDIYLETKLCTLIAEACVSNDKHETLDDCWKKICKEKKQIQIDCCVRQKNYFGYEYGIGQNITSAMTLGIIFLIILFIYESYIIQTLCERLGRRCSPKPPIAPEHLDDDVAAQQEMVHNADENKLITTHEVVLKDLTKYYGNFLAVNGTCLVIDKYECFGLLGVNGAGKTTTFQMMTGDVPITYGNAWIGGYSIITQYRKAQKLIGYCPQFDALIDNMTCRESLIVFGLLRGIKPGNCDKTAVQLAKDFDFFRHIDKQTKQLSGGNKRKLSTAISIIGNPAIVFLDEPTTGMDPTTKQFLWTAICAVRDSGKVVILTSHSMEECEALCTKLAIQVNGIFMCLGSVQHMKNKFAEGYTLIIKLSREIPLKTAADEVIQYINKTFSKAVVKERHQELITFFVPKQKIPLSRMFGILEKYKTTNKKVEDYSLSQSSLEQIFLQFVKFQKERSK